jgi:energy-coupling factor transport system permease protein
MLLGFMVFLTSSLLAKTLVSVGLLGLILSLGLYFSGVKLSYSAKLVRRLAPLLLITFIIHYIVTAHTADVFSVGSVSILITDPLARASIFTLRLFLILLASLGLSQAHPIPAYGESVAKALNRVPLFRGLSSRLSLTATLALRFIPFVHSQFERLQLTSQARGMLNSASRRDRIRTHGKFLYPLMISSLRRADQTAIALKARGFDSRVHRSFYKVEIIPISVWIVLLLFTLLCIIAVRFSL